MVLTVSILCFVLPVYGSTAVENRLTGPAIESGEVGKETMFHPHRASTTNGEVLDDKKFENAQVCGACHVEIYQEWRSSIMALAWDDPIYRALLKKASIATDGKIDNFCTGCHTPIGLLTGKINSNVNREGPDPTAESQLPGVDCEACHNVTGISGMENGAYVINVTEGNEKLKFGPRANAVSPYHETQESVLHTRSEFCSTCHNVTHPFNNVPIERTYDEWFESAYRTDGVECQDCHMAKEQDKAATMGPKRKDRRSHDFAAANTTILKYFGNHKKAKKARRLLQSSAELEFVGLPDSFSPGSYANVSVKVKNVGAGHKLPTGFPEGREVWLDFVVSDKAGKELFRLGEIKNGKTEVGTKNFRVHMGDKDGNEVDIEVWNVDRILSDNRIMPHGYAVEDFRFFVPEDVQGPLNLSVNLNYWPFSQAFADTLLGKDFLVVDIERITGLSDEIIVVRDELVSTN